VNKLTHRGVHTHHLEAVDRMRKGLTLVETIVFMALSLLLIGLLARLLLPSLRASSRASAQVELQQMATLAMNSIGRELGRSNGRSVSLSPHGLALVCSNGISSSGHRLWEQQAIFYLWEQEENRLFRQDWPPGPPDLGVEMLPTRPARFNSAHFREVERRPNETRRYLASHVVGFEVSHGGGESPSIVPPLTVKLTLEKGTSGGRKETFELDRTYAFRN
jgi:type II secretory pathway pseudopilin PulG